LATVRFATRCHRLRPLGSKKAPHSVVPSDYAALRANPTVPVRDSALAKRERDGPVKLELAAGDDPVIEGRRGELADPFGALVAVALPSAERRERALVLDRSPQASRALELPALRRDARDQGDAEHAAGPVVQALGDCKGFTGMSLGFVDAAGSK